ncbi:MAG: hypothetical protein QG652_1400 [Pseudomonadota bacterium]|nr:hypothetical protein [Pseudomonadota bacterium]
MKFPESPFRNYTSQLLQMPEVASVCLAMQDNFDADVNLLLFCCWAAENRRQLDDGDIHKLIQAGEPWQSVIIRPLRETRKLMKSQVIAMPTYLHTKTMANLTEMEINAEHMAQLNLEKTIIFSRHETGELSVIDTAARNLMTYVQKLEKIQSRDVTGHIATLLCHIYGDDETVQVAMTAVMA